jgi:hypothetical protein
MFDREIKQLREIRGGYPGVDLADLPPEPRDRAQRIISRWARRQLRQRLGTARYLCWRLTGR